MNREKFWYQRKLKPKIVNRSHYTIDFMSSGKIYVGYSLSNVAETEETETGKGPQTIKFLLKGEFLGEF